MKEVPQTYLIQHPRLFSPTFFLHRKATNLIHQFFSYFEGDPININHPIAPGVDELGRDVFIMVSHAFHKCSKAIFLEAIVLFQYY